jgi:hypothetical protein
MDFDHAVEHCVRSRHPFCIRTFMSRHNTLDWPRITFILHSYELTAIVLILALRHESLSWWAVFAGSFSHILLDQVGNRMPSSPGTISPWFYFILYRMSHGFRRDILVIPRPGPQGNGQLER